MRLVRVTHDNLRHEFSVLKVVAILSLEFVFWSSEMLISSRDKYYYYYYYYYYFNQQLTKSTAYSFKCLTFQTFFYSCPPRTFLPALCRIFLDECAPENVLEVTARAITYYLDVSAECTRRIVAVEGAIKALCNRLVVVDLSSRTSKDLGEQCVKVSAAMKPN